MWTKSKICELLDSIYKGYPIGSFFLWDAGTGYAHIFKHLAGINLDPPGPDDDVSFVLDGQQRLTSLYLTLTGLLVEGVNYADIYFDPTGPEFCHEARNSNHLTRLCDLWGPDGTDTWDDATGDVKEALKKCWKSLQTYPISIVEVSGMGLPDVCKIFQRINQAGKRLDRFDLVCTITFSEQFDPREQFDALSDELENDKFGKIDPGCIAQLLALHCFGDCAESSQFDLTPDLVQTHWAAAKKATKDAAILLRQNVCVIDASFLPYDAHLTLTSYFLMQLGNAHPTNAQLEWLRKWFWTTAFSQHYGAGASTKINNDKTLMEQLAGGQFPAAPCTLSVSADELIAVKMSQTTSARRNAFLCLLATLNPLSLKNSQPYDLVNGDVSEFNRKEKHHIFPQAFLATNYPQAEIHTLPNFCFIDAQLNKVINASSPSAYMPQLESGNQTFDQALQSHLLPSLQGSALLQDDFTTFIQDRAAAIVATIQGLC